RTGQLAPGGHRRRRRSGDGRDEPGSPEQRAGGAAPGHRRQRRGLPGPALAGHLGDGPTCQRGGGAGLPGGGHRAGPQTGPAVAGGQRPSRRGDPDRQRPGSAAAAGRGGPDAERVWFRGGCAMTRRLVAPLLVALAFGLGLAAAPQGEPSSQRTVFLAGDLSDEALIVLTSAVAASGESGVVLLDSPKARPYTEAVLKAYGPDKGVPVGTSPNGAPGVKGIAKEALAPPLAWKRGPPEALWKMLFPRAERVVVCPAEPRGLLLQSGCLAGVLRAPLVVLRGQKGEA